MTIPDQTLREIIELEKKATLGPWIARDYPDKKVILAQAFTRVANDCWMIEDANLIVHSRNNIRAMAEELLASRRLIEAQSFVNHHYGDDELPPRAIQELMGAAKAYAQLSQPKGPTV